jgi:DNA-binding NarL/FixJ family response regulator
MQLNNKKVKLLLVDDHVMLRSGVRLMLSSDKSIDIAGEAESAQDALKMVREHHYDVALVDIAMPGKNGLELLRLLRTEVPRLAVLILSMYAEEIYAVRALKLGAAGYLTKNSHASTLIAAIHKAASGGRYMSAELIDRLAGMAGGESALPHDTLSDRELEVLKLIASGETTAKIAEKLHLSQSSITTYRTRIIEKMGFKNNADFYRYAIDNGLIV